MQAIELFLDSNRGAYIPKNFAERINRDMIRCDTSRLNLSAMLDWLESADPYEDSEEYWLTWEDILTYCYIEYNGNIWRLWQDSDLWLYCDELMTEQEKADFLRRYNNASY